MRDTIPWRYLYIIRAPWLGSRKHSVIRDQFEIENFRLFKIRSPQPPSIYRNYHGYILNTRKTRLAYIRIFSSPQPDSQRCFQRWNRVPNPPGPFALPLSPSELTCSWPFASSDRCVCFRRIPNSDRGVNPNTNGGADRVVIMNETAFGCFNVEIGQAVGDWSESQGFGSRLKGLGFESNCFRH